MDPKRKQTADAQVGAHDDTERRDLQRVPLECNALVRIAEYLTFRAQLRNISADAVQVACDPRYALLIQPGGVKAKPDGDRLIDISVALPEHDDTGDFKAQCRVKYCVEDAENKERMVLGLQFVTMDFRSVQHLDRFMESNGYLLDKTLSESLVVAFRDS